MHFAAIFISVLILGHCMRFGNSLTLILYAMQHFVPPPLVPLYSKLNVESILLQAPCQLQSRGERVGLL